MTVNEIGRLERSQGNSETSGYPSSQRTTDRSEIVAAIRAAAKEGGLPEFQDDIATGAKEMQIAFDRESKQFVVKVMNRETQEVVRQIPAEDVLSRARFFVETSQRTSQGTSPGTSQGTSQGMGR